MFWIKIKSESLLTPVTLENMDSTIHDLNEWTVEFSEVTIDPGGLYKYITPHGDDIILGHTHSLLL